MPKSFIKLIQLTFLLSSFLFLLPKITLAANCEFKYYDSSNPDTATVPNQNMNNLVVDITSKELQSGNYYVQFKSATQNQPMRYLFSANGGSDLISFSTNQTSRFIINKPSIGWSSGDYAIYFVLEGKNNQDSSFSCQTKFTISNLSPQACTVIIKNTPLYPDTGVVMTVPGISPDSRYDIYVNDKILEDWGKKYHIYDHNADPEDLGTFPPGDYTIKLYKEGDCARTPSCTPRLQCNPGTFTVLPSGTSPNPPTPNSDCYISPTPPVTQLSDVFIVNTKVPQNARFYADRKNTQTGELIQSADQTSSSNGGISIQLGTKNSVGNYIAHLYQADGKQLCELNYTVEDEANIAKAKQQQLDQCIQRGECSVGGGDPCGDEKNPGFKTAIGCIHTQPKALVEDALTFATGIGGGLAFMMMLFGAFQMLTSGGNPQNLQGGRDVFQNALIGLLFIIFSILLMKIIGIDILNIPGFTPNP